MKNILIVCLCVAGLLFGGWKYVSGLKDDRDTALLENGALRVVVRAQNATIQELRNDRVLVDALSVELAEKREGIQNEQQERQNASKTARETDPDFVDWENRPLPAAVRNGGVLGKTARNRASAATGGSDPASGMDSASSNPAMAGENQR